MISILLLLIRFKFETKDEHLGRTLYQQQIGQQPAKKINHVEHHRTRRPLRHPKVSPLRPRSMIAQLPGRKNFMGDHLELVCLLQAAEI